MSQADILHENTILHARNIVFPSSTKVSDGAKEFIRKCCTYRKELRPDVFQLCNDDYLKPKAQLKHNLDTSSLPGPVGIPPNSCMIPTFTPASGISTLPQSSHISSGHQASAFATTQPSHTPCPSLQPLSLNPPN
ncbi:unnamed protein product [Echinostoma caproni]|uniref:BLOC-1-related complex subunit 5 n=1 Tax=Echinostoma caproni TaxID=27848 RepID=A0A183ARB6_9TREM|nr:unnamed protein product [Echinostoma caproni]